MNLQSVRVRQGANLQQLKALLEGQGWRSALPTALPDELLLRLAYDFRCVERSIITDSSESEQVPSLAAALYITMKVLIQHPARARAAAEFTLSEQSMMKALQMYHWAVEHEVVSRIVGQARSDVTDQLLDGLGRCLHE